MNVIFVFDPSEVYAEELEDKKNMISAEIKRNKLIGFSKTPREILLKEIRERLETLYLSQDLIEDERGRRRFMFKGERIMNEINAYIKKDEYKIKGYDYIYIETGVYEVLQVRNKKETFSVVELYIMTNKDTYSALRKKAQYKAFKEYVMENIFKYVKYNEI